MIKKIMIGVMAAALFVGLLPNMKTLAATGGLFDGKYLPIYSAPTTTTNKLTDGDTATGVNIRYGTEIPVYELDTPTTIGRIYVNSGADTANTSISFYKDKARTQLIKQVTLSSLGVVPGQWNNILPISDVMSMYPNTGGKSLNITLSELDFQLPEPEKPVYTGKKYSYNTDFTYSPTENITTPENLFDDFASTAATIKYSSTTTFDFKNPIPIKSILTIGSGMTFTFYDEAGNNLGGYTVSSNMGAATARETPINLSNVKKTTMRNTSGNNATMNYLAFTYERAYLPASDLKATPKEREISLTWNNPTAPGLKETEIHVNGTLNKKVATNNTTITGLSPETTYEIKVITVYDDGVKAAAITATATTLIETVKKILEAKATTDYNRVNLSWKLPDQAALSHVNIYRKEITEEPGLIESLFMGTIVSAAEEPTKIFETNGTYFNDLTVTPETSYEYTLTTQTEEGKESEPVTVEATTTAEPAPKIEGEKYEVDQNGDYLFTWEQPTEGTVKIIVGGKEYATTEAANKQFIIPKEDMKLTGLGNPDVTLQPISKYGTEGEKTSTGENNSILKLPFSVNDFVSSGFELFAYVGSFLLLALSFLLFPKLRKVIVDSFRGNRKEEGQTVHKRSFRRFRDIQNEARERHEGKEHIEKTEREVKERQDKERTEKERQERERRERETAAPKEKSPRPSKERHRERKRAEKQPRRERAAREPRAPRERKRAPREPRGKRGAS